MEKELAVAQAADKIHRNFLGDSYVLSPFKNTGNKNIRMRSEEHMDFADKDDMVFDKNGNVLDAKIPSFVPRFIPSARPKFTQRYITTPNPPTSLYAHAMFAAPESQAAQPTFRNTAQTENTLSNLENTEAIKM